MKKYVSPFLAFCLLLAACTKTSTTVTPVVAPPPRQMGYLLSTIVNDNGELLGKCIYDSSNHLLKEYIYPEPGSGSTTRYNTYSYNSAGLLETMTLVFDDLSDDSATYQYSYDGNGRVIRRREVNAFDSSAITFSYNSVGELVSVYANGLKTIDYKYDDNGNVVAEADYFIDSRTGKQSAIRSEYQYDNNPHPSDYLYYVPGDDPLAINSLSQSGSLAQSLSRNNIITNNHSGANRYLYTYNAQGYPATIVAEESISSSSSAPIHLSYIKAN